MNNSILRIEEKEKTIDFEFDLIKKNNQLAEENRRTFMENGVKAFDIMGSVGSGKTSLIECIVKILNKKYSIAVINGDLATTIDAERVSKYGVKVVQINTGKECHLDAYIVRKAIEKIDLKSIDLLFIENVGNLICPSDFKLGTEKRVVVISVTEGEHVVVKHPLTFLEADVVVVNKVDLAEIMGVDVKKVAKDVKTINPNVKVVETSCKTGLGIDKV
ncbi:MAG: hydrogenase nickel incorporation protein HypB, partial [Candidatus Bathyarchaeota archaeon]|nr:hydrogenase nickel incorporation protein HypB [Candidatus Bathyarchaeota archaeon]